MSDQESAADVPTETVTLSVPDMDCPSCAEKVTSSVRRLAGVRSISARPTSGRLVVTTDPTAADRAAIVDRVERAGYGVAGEKSPAGGESGEQGPQVAPPASVWTSDEAMQVWAAAVAMVAGLVVEFLLPGLDATLVVVAGVDAGPVTIPAFDLGVADGLLLAAVALAGLPVVRAGLYSARQVTLDIDLLMGAAIVGATAIGLFEEAATLAVLFSIAELLERYAMDRARNSLRELMDLSPDTATVRRDGTETEVPVDEVAVDDVVVVRPGERIPVDGEVVDGESAVDQSPITGESVPVDKTLGDEVFAGTITAEGYLEVRATAPASESTIANVIDLVADAEAAQTDREQFVERFAAVYTPAVVALAVLTMVVPPFVLEGPLVFEVAGFSQRVGADWQTWFVSGLTLLVISCPCAFVISTPVSVVSAVTSAARNGVLIKGGNYLEAMGAIEAVALDKTGTLTTGELGVTDVVPVGDRTTEDVLELAAALEERSEHPIAAAIREHATDADVDPQPVTDFESITGKGVRATIDGTTYYAGKPGLFADMGVDLREDSLRTNGGRPLATQGVDGDDGVAPAPDEADRSDDTGDGAGETAGVIGSLQDKGKSIVLVGTDDEVVGVVAVADRVRPDAARVVERLQTAGLTVAMLTGDNERTAAAIADEVGIDDYRADLLPAEKVDAVEALTDSYGDVAMVGDGVNDAPALATASVGVAMGAAGTDTAIETADIALLGDDLGKLPYLYALSHKANGVIRENIWSSLGVKFLLALGVPIGLVGVATAVLVGDMGMSLGVTGNSMRLSRLKPASFR